MRLSFIRLIKDVLLTLTGSKHGRRLRVHKVKPETCIVINDQQRATPLVVAIEVNDSISS